MFPIKSGNNINTPDSGQILVQSLTASALHEIANQAIIDTSLLLFHQQAAEIYHRRAEGLEIPTAADGTYEVYSKVELAELRRLLIDVVMKFHIFDENGMANKLTPLVRYIDSHRTISQRAMRDPLIAKVWNGKDKFRDDLANSSLQTVLEKIIDFEDVVDNAADQMVRDSYDSDDEVDIAVWEDGEVQCACNFCEDFFQILGKIDSIDRTRLNSLQRLLMTNYNF